MAGNGAERDPSSVEHTTLTDDGNHLDASRAEFVTLLRRGLSIPPKSLENAVTVAGILLLIGSTPTEEPKSENSPLQPHLPSRMPEYLQASPPDGPPEVCVVGPACRDKTAQWCERFLLARQQHS